MMRSRRGPRKLLTRDIRRREPGARHVPIIAMTANSMQGERERCLAAGIDDYLTKPLRISSLKDALTQWACEPPVGTTAEDGALPTEEGLAAEGGSELLQEAVVAELEALEGEVLPDLLSLYFDEAAGHMSELSDATGRGQAVCVGRTAHKLKGSSRTLGAAHVSHIASDLEATARAGDLTVADGLLDWLRGGLAHTQNAFDSRAAGPSDDGNAR
jgi:HPt (histidine-containing phosphotransfer) domain-containing protein